MTQQIDPQIKQLFESLINSIDLPINQEETIKNIGLGYCCDFITILIFSYLEKYPELIQDNELIESYKYKILNLIKLKAKDSYNDYLHDYPESSISLDLYIQNIWLTIDTEYFEYYGGNSSYNVHGVTEIVLRKIGMSIEAKLQ